SRGRWAGRGRAAGTGAAGTRRRGTDDAGRGCGGREGRHRPRHDPRRRLAVPPRRYHPVPAAGGSAGVAIRAGPGQPPPHRRGRTTPVEETTWLNATRHSTPKPTSAAGTRTRDLRRPSNSAVVART